MFNSFKFLLLLFVFNPTLVLAQKKSISQDSMQINFDALTGLRLYQKQSSDTKNLLARAQESYLSLNFRPFPKFSFLSFGLGYLFVEFISADWQNPETATQLHSPSAEILFSGNLFGRTSIYSRWRLILGGEISGYYPKASEAAKKISLKGQYLSIGSCFKLTPLAALLFEITKGIEYTQESPSGGQTYFRPITFLAGFQLGLNPPS